MKKYISYMLSAVLSLAFTASCTDYLSIPVEADKTDEDVFGDYYNFQGYVDQLYLYIPNPIQLTSDNTWGGETISTTTWATGYNGVRGLYWQFTTRGYMNWAEDNNQGLWQGGWNAIRAANLGLANLNLLQATEEERNWIEGQLLFFRAFFHQEMLAAWGPIPYLKEILVDDFQQPRFFEYNGKTGYQAVAEQVIEDMHRAAELLPIAWPEPTKNLGRCTALTAKGYEARACLYAGSPLMTEYSGTSLDDRRAAQVDKGYMERAAAAAGELIMLAKNNPEYYGLLDWEHYSDMFYTVELAKSPWSKETLWAREHNVKGQGCITNILGRIHLPDQSIFGGNAVNNTPTQNYVDLFEMKNGSLYDKSMDGETYMENGTQRLKMWDDRDARFRRNIYVDRDVAGLKDDPDPKKKSTRLFLYTGGKTRNADNCQTPYYIHKYWPKGANKLDNGTIYKNMRFMVPLMRLAEIYLIYAEAVNEAYDDPGRTAGGCDITGLEAVNIIRQRADGQPPTDSNGGAHGSFRKMILNERAVELCFEGFYWFDIRRYKLGENMNGEEVQTLDFDAEWTNFSRRTLLNRTFETPKHYWMPFPSDLCKMYPEFMQNTGWE